MNNQVAAYTGTFGWFKLVASAPSQDSPIRGLGGALGSFGLRAADLLRILMIQLPLQGGNRVQIGCRCRSRLRRGSSTKSKLSLRLQRPACLKLYSCAALPGFCNCCQPHRFRATSQNPQKPTKWPDSCSESITTTTNPARNHGQSNRQPGRTIPCTFAY